MQMGSKFPEGEGGDQRPRKSPPGSGEWLDGESELLAAEGRKGSRAGKGAGGRYIWESNFQEWESLHACSLVSFWLGRARGEGEVEACTEGGGGEQTSRGEADAWRVDFLKGGWEARVFDREVSCWGGGGAAGLCLKPSAPTRGG